MTENQTPSNQTSSEKTVPGDEKPEILTMCKDAPALRAWLKKYLNIELPEHPFCDHHHTPFEYLDHTYFDRGDVIVHGPRGGGKTRLAAVATLLDLLHKPGIGIRILGGSLEQALKVWEHLVPDLEKHAADLLPQNTIRGKHVKLSDGSSVAALTQSQRAVRGTRVQKMRCDEVEMFTRDVWTAVGPTTRSLTLPGGKHIPGIVEALSTHHNPYGLMHHIMEQARQRGTKVITWCILDVMAFCTKTPHDCPTCPLYNDCNGKAQKKRADGTPYASGFLPVDDVIAIKLRLSPETWDAEMCCKHPRRDGLVFSRFDPKIHVREFRPDEPQEGFSLGVDFGYTNPFVALWIVRSLSGTVYVRDEYVEAKRTIREHIHEIRRKPWVVDKIFCDPAGAAKSDQTGESCIDILRKSGFLVTKSSTHILDGVEAIRFLLSPIPRLIIHPTCKRLIRALEQYHYPDKPQPGELPDKDGTHDHLIDALRYWLMNEKKGELQTRLR